MSLTSVEIAAAEETKTDDAERLYTADELLEISSRDDNRYELLHGRLRIMPPAGDEHGFLASTLNARIHIHAEDNDLGYTFAAETGFLLERDPDLVRAPDVAFVVTTRLPVKLGGKYFPGAPDLAVEVVSPNDKVSEVQNKIQDLAHPWRSAEFGLLTRRAAPSPSTVLMVPPTSSNPKTRSPAKMCCPGLRIRLRSCLTRKD